MKRRFVAAISLLSMVGVTPAAATSTQYREIKDSSEALEVEVPDDWTDIDPSQSAEGFQRILASPELRDAYNNWDTPRVALFAHKGTNVWTALTKAGEEASRHCKLFGQATWSNREYSGQMALYRDCNHANDGSQFLAIGARNGEDYVVGIGILMITEADRGASRHIQDTFDVVGEITG